MRISDGSSDVCFFRSGEAGPGGASGVIPGGPGGSAGPEGATGSIPGGPGGTAGPGGASGGIPGGPVGSARPGGASGCIPGVGCATIPAPYNVKTLPTFQNRPFRYEERRGGKECVSKV